MKGILLILLTTFSFLAAQAQVDSLRLAKTDSVTSSINHRADSLAQKAQSLQNPKLKIPFSNKADSLKDAINAKLHKPDELAAKLKHKADSINQQHQIEQYNKKVTVLQKHLSNHIDSLSNLKIKTPQLTQSIDSLRGKLDSLKNAGPVKDVKRAEQQLAQLRTKLNSKVKGLQSKMSKDFGEIGKLGGNVPNVNLPNVNLPNTNLPNLTLPKLNTQLPGASTNLNLNTTLPGT